MNTGLIFHIPYCGPKQTLHPSANVDVTPSTLKHVIFHKAHSAQCTSRTAETNTTLLDTHEYSTRVPSDNTVADYAGCTRLGTMLLAHTTAHASAPQLPKSKTCMTLSHRAR